MQARLTAFLLWAALAATIVFWALRLGARAPAVPPQAVAVSTAAGARGDLGRLLGERPAQEEAAPPPSADAGRFQLVGVVAPRGGSSSEGLAVIAVDGKPARTYRVGMALDDRYVLQSLRPRGADLGPRGGSAQIQLDLPPLPVASTGVLPPAGSEAPATLAPERAPMGLPRGQVPPGMGRPPMPQQMPQQGMPQQFPPQEMPPQEMPPQEMQMPVPQQELEQQPMPDPGQGQGG